MRERGIEVQFITLKQLVDQYNVENGILKLDCEDCEYDVILLSDIKTLHKFNDIIIEFHHGFRLLKERLEKNGYTVKIAKHKFGKDSDTGQDNETGLIYATLV